MHRLLKVLHNIRNFTNQYQLPLHIVLGLIKIESDFNPNIRKFEPHLNTASYGLTQILETTAKGLGWKPSITHLIKHDLYNVNTNLKYGLLYFKKLFEKYKNWNDAIASYNMGFPRKAQNTTPIIIKIFGVPKPHWVYANQPYVDLVNLWSEYYLNYLNNNKSNMIKILERIKLYSKSIKKPPNMLNLILFLLFPEILFLIFIKKKKKK